MGSHDDDTGGYAAPLSDLEGIEWWANVPCEICGNSDYTCVVFLIRNSGQIVICPFCLGRAIDQGTGWGTVKVMRAWENTKKVHAAIKRGEMDPWEAGGWVKRRYTQWRTSRTEP